MPVIYHNLTLRPGKKEAELLKLCERKLHAPVRYFRILKKSLDARDKSNIKWVYSVECSSRPEQSPARTYPRITRPAPKVFIAGAGPAGLFCALRLIRHGIQPVLLERGKPVEERAEDIANFFQTGVLAPDSNVQFGEGGAGTFSDGKLYTQTNSAFHREILETFVEFGAPEEIAYLGRPHIGSDKLRLVIANMRRYILEHGGTIRYSSKLDDVRIKDGALTAVSVNGAW